MPLPKTYFLKYSKNFNKSFKFSSRRFITDQQFFKDTYLSKECQIMKDDFLLECINCHIIVHRNCYPVFNGLPGLKLLFFK